MKERGGERRKKRLSADLLPKYLQQPGKARHLEVHLGLPGGWQEPKYWTAMLYPPGTLMGS